MDERTNSAYEQPYSITNSCIKKVRSTCTALPCSTLMFTPHLLCIVPLFDNPSIFILVSGSETASLFVEVALRIDLYCCNINGYELFRCCACA